MEGRGLADARDLSAEVGDVALKGAAIGLGVANPLAVGVDHIHYSGAGLEAVISRLRLNQHFSERGHGQPPQ